MLGAPLWMAHDAPLFSTSSALTAHTRHSDCVSTTVGASSLTMAASTEYKGAGGEVASEAAEAAVAAAT